MDGSRSKNGPRRQTGYLWKAESKVYKIGMGLVSGFHCKKIRNLSVKLKISLVAIVFGCAQTKRYLVNVSDQIHGDHD